MRLIRKGAFPNELGDFAPLRGAADGDAAEWQTEAMPHCLRRISLHADTSLSDRASQLWTNKDERSQISRVIAELLLSFKRAEKCIVCRIGDFSSLMFE